MKPIPFTLVLYVQLSGSLGISSSTHQIIKRCPITVYCARHESFVRDASQIADRREAMKLLGAGLLHGAFLAGLGPILPSATMADTGADVRGIGVNPFNSLTFQYRGSEFGGLDASSIDEPSIPYLEFVQRLHAGDVAFVEFMAPNGDVAYVTFKANSDHPSAKSTRIRIGEGYPVEKSDGWSSPAFAVRTVQNARVPYKFAIPALSSSDKIN